MNPERPVVRLARRARARYARDDRSYRGWAPTWWQHGHTRACCGRSRARRTTPSCFAGRRSPRRRRPRGRLRRSPRPSRRSRAFPAWPTGRPPGSSVVMPLAPSNCRTRPRRHQRRAPVANGSSRAAALESSKASRHERPPQLRVPPPSRRRPLVPPDGLRRRAALEPATRSPRRPPRFPRWSRAPSGPTTIKRRSRRHRRIPIERHHRASGSDPAR